MGQIIRVALAMNGIVTGHMKPWRWLLILGSLAFYYGALAQRPSLGLAAWYFVAATAAHYAYLFGVFARSAGSRRLRARHGDEPAFQVHEGWMAFVFLHNGLSIGWLCLATRGVPLAGLSLPHPSLALAVLGVAGVVIGLGTKIWATLIVGIDAYYYRDLFLERGGGGLRREGPYRWFRDPMYTVGHLHAYGVALWYGSAWGLAAAAVNQALVLLFNTLVEQPHVRRIHARPLGDPV